MNLQIASDLHREFLNEKQRNPSHVQYEPMIDTNTDADVIVLAGDIDCGPKSLKWMDGLGKPVIYIAGNHEYYGQTISVGKDIFNESMRRDNVRFLDGDIVQVGDIVIVGGTLWTDFNLHPDAKSHAKWLAPHYMSDYRACSGLTPDFVEFIHEQHLAAIKLGRETAREQGKKLVVISHHLPSKQAIHPKWSADRHSLANMYYASNLDYLLEDGSISLWIHGHTHESMDSVIGKTRVICNPRGYNGTNNTLPHLNPSFNPRLVVEV